ncbi:hypothetical protein BCR44DRAFT_1497573 [Catenaria anguillulae PL171]|uniref:Uncharacterized protein n=1 Tax=Catenaria anguillulae PL171 TaxID=765915 RepID=A0A1Y2HTQ7_9FUNG|nr:hypothetical protein BCR44DRAFT_1497573 [Catenaria anguillulae PL171]
MHIDSMQSLFKTSACSSRPHTAPPRPCSSTTTPSCHRHSHNPWLFCRTTSLLTAILVLTLTPTLASTSTSTSLRLSLSIQQLSASAPGLSASITCLIPPTAPASYSCQGFASHLTQEAVDALDRDTLRNVGNRCSSAMSHVGALAFASSIRYWKLQRNKELLFVPSCAVKNLAASGKLALANGVTALDVNYDADILVQVRSDWNDWYFSPADGPMHKHHMDIRITLQHELIHGLGMALAGVDTDIVPGLALPWHYPAGAKGKWAGWTDATPLYFTHLVDRKAGTPLSDLAAEVKKWNDESVAVAQVGQAMQLSAPNAYAAAKRMYELNTTPGAIMFRPSPLISKVNGDIVVDSASANASSNSLVHLDSATYNSTVDDIILIPDTAAYAGRAWNATLGPHLGAVLGSLGFPKDMQALERMAAELTVTHAVPVHLLGERIDVMGWKWNWVKHGPWQWVNAGALLLGGGVWGWMARRDWIEVKRVRGWSTLPGMGR